MFRVLQEIKKHQEQTLQLLTALATKVEVVLRNQARLERSMSDQQAQVQQLDDDIKQLAADLQSEAAAVSGAIQAIQAKTAGTGVDLTSEISQLSSFHGQVQELTDSLKNAVSPPTGSAPASPGSGADTNPAVASPPASDTSPNPAGQVP